MPSIMHNDNKSAITLNFYGTKLPVSSNKKNIYNGMDVF